MNRKDREMDMLHGPLLKKILLFTLPIALSSMLQQLFNAADTSIVGYFDSANSLAAVGTNGEIIALIVSLSSGLAIGVNVLIANQIGQKKTDKIPEIVHTSIMLAVLIGITGLFIGQFITRPLLSLIQTPDKIIGLAEIYLRIYFLGYPFLLLYDFGSAVLRARGDSRYPFLALTFAGVINVLLNVFFVIVMRIGVAGVAIATDISTALSAGLVIWRLYKDIARSFTQIHIHPEYVSQILKTGIPSVIQGAVFCFANIFVQASVNSFGETAIAGSTVAMNFEYLTYYIITAFGQTATTFASQNHAAGQLRRCRQILWRCLGLSIVCSSVPIFTTVLFRGFFSGLFTHDSAVILSAGVRIMCILLYEPICNLYEIPAGVLRGSGHAAAPAVSAMIGTCAFRIVWIFTAFRVSPTLPMLYHAFPLSWVVTILLVNTCFLLIRPLSKRHGIAVL